MSENFELRDSHWKKYYSLRNSRSRHAPPSQFAAFVAQELDHDCKIVDIGCGNGRDTLFFSSLGFHATGIDQSKEGIEVASQLASERGLVLASFFNSNVNSDAILDVINAAKNSLLCVYGRFFLHAISIEEQTELFASLASVLKAGDKLAFEYRTRQDETQIKDAIPHFRRFQDAVEVDQQLHQLGFEKIYGVEGTGFAKYKCEDAYVARGLFQKKSN